LEPAEGDKRRHGVWDIDKQVKGPTIMVNSQYNGGAWKTSIAPWQLPRRAGT